MIGVIAHNAAAVKAAKPVKSGVGTRVAADPMAMEVHHAVPSKHSARLGSSGPGRLAAAVAVAWASSASVCSFDLVMTSL